MKSGIEYFPLDCQLDDKFDLIEAEFGLTGFAVVVKLLQKIYAGQGYYCEWTKEVALLFGKKIGLGGNAVSEIVEASVRRGIFDRELYEKYSVLTSKGIQERYLEAVSRRKKVEVKKEYLLINCVRNYKNVDISSKNVCINQKNVYISEQSKVEESKVKESRVKESNEPNSSSQKQKTTRHKYGEYKHVLLTDEQYSKLIGDYSETIVKEYIKKVDEYCQQYGRKYNDYNLTIRKWLRKDGKNADNKQCNKQSEYHNEWNGTVL